MNKFILVLCIKILLVLSALNICAGNISELLGERIEFAFNLQIKDGQIKMSLLGDNYYYTYLLDRGVAFFKNLWNEYLDKWQIFELFVIL